MNIRILPQFQTFSAGTQEGHILVFGVPAKGTNVVIKDVLKGLFIFFYSKSSKS